MAGKFSKIAQIDKGSLKRILGVGDLFAVGYGDLGSSIYYALGITTLFSLGAAPISLAIAGFVFACTALSYAELSSMMKDGGGSSTFARHAFNDLISFIAGWGLLLDFIVTVAISSFAIAPYLAFFFSGLKIIPIKIAFTVSVITVLFIINYFGTKHSTKMSWFLTILTLSTQVLIVIVGSFWFIKFPDLWEHLRIGVKGSAFSPTWPEFWKGTAMAMVAYTGIESMAQLGGEAKNPGRSVPKAMMLAMTILLITYIGIAVVALSALTPQVLSSQFLEDPISGIVSQLPFGKRVLGGWIGLLAAMILFVASNAGLMGASRLAFNMGEFYQLPRAFYYVHKKYKTPCVALAVFAVLAIIIVLFSRGQLEFLANLYNFGAMMAFFMTHLSLIVFRVKHPNADRPFKVPLNISIGKYKIPITSIIGACATALTWCLVVITKKDGRNLGFLWITIGLLIYFSFRKKQSISPTAKVKIHKVDVPDFSREKYSNILVPVRGGKNMKTMQMACDIAKIHQAVLTVVHVIEVPFSLSINMSLAHRNSSASLILDRAEAIAREFNISIRSSLIHSRSIDQAIIELIKKHNYDLLVLGMSISTLDNTRPGSGVITNIAKGVHCPIWICAQEY